AAVVDDKGDLLAVMRMDGVGSPTLLYAIKKARSAALTRRDTREQRELFDRTGWQHADFADFITTVPGGITITRPGVSRKRDAGGKGPEVYGGIGCSGRSADGDEVLAFIGLHALQEACWGKSD
ncbi:MAG: heme-binding protein, partial [Pseudomonadota bacterium]